MKNLKSIIKSLEGNGIIINNALKGKINKAFNALETWGKNESKDLTDHVQRQIKKSQEWLTRGEIFLSLKDTIDSNKIYSTVLESLGTKVGTENNYIVLYKTNLDNPNELSKFIVSNIKTVKDTFNQSIARNFNNQFASDEKRLTIAKNNANKLLTAAVENLATPEQVKGMKVDVHNLIANGATEKEVSDHVEKQRNGLILSTTPNDTKNEVLTELVKEGKPLTVEAINGKVIEMYNKDEKNIIQRKKESKVLESLELSTFSLESLEALQSKVSLQIAKLKKASKVVTTAKKTKTAKTN